MTVRRPTRLRFALLALSTLALVASAAAPAVAANPHDLLRATLAPSLPTDPTIRGVVPGGAPWVIDRGTVRVRDDGRVDVRVDGLVIPPPTLPNTNPLPTLSVSVSCEGEPLVSSGTVPFSADGDARLRADLPVPQDCLAPIVFVHPNAATGVYIAVTGR